MRHYTALKDGVPVRSGTFQNEELLRMDLPPDEYELLLDQIVPLPEKMPGYAENRRVAYPPQSDYIDAMYWHSKGDGTKLAAYWAACEAVKAAYPKEI